MRSAYVSMRGFSGITSSLFSDDDNDDEMAATFAVAFSWSPFAVRRLAWNLMVARRSEKFILGSPRRRAFSSFFQKCSLR